MSLEPSQAPSWRDALWGAALGCGIAIVGVGLLIGLAQVSHAQQIGNPEVLGRATVEAGLFLFVLAAASAIAWARRARRMAVLTSLLALVVTLGPIVAATRGPQRFAYPPPDEHESAPPQLYTRDGTQMWIQPAIGLELLAPEGLHAQAPGAVPAPTATSPDDETASVQWAWTNDARDRALIIWVGLTVTYDEPSENARYVDGLLHGLTSSMGPAGFVILESERRGPNELVLYAQHETLGDALMRTIAYRHGDVLVTVTATAIGAEHAQLIPAVESMRGRPEHTTPP